jgi:hypothetical protein
MSSVDSGEIDFTKELKRWNFNVEKKVKINTLIELQQFK